MIDLQQLSSALADVAAGAARSVVHVEGRRAGSGTIWSDGVVVTAAHFVEGDDEVEVGLPSGEVVRAEVAGRDPATDLALLRAAGASALAAPEWREAPPSIGEPAIALSRPGRFPRAGFAVVARVSPDAWRGPGGARLDRFVELDVALHPGFSGGIAVDLAGRALGLTTAGILRGSGLALPPSTLRRVVESLLAHGAIRRGYLGLATVPARVPASLRGASGQEAALVVTALDDDGPAADAGVLLGDALLALDGHALGHPGDLVALLEEERIGLAATLRLLRAGEPREIPLTIGARGGRR